MLRSDDIKVDSLYECYCKVEDDNEKKWAKKLRKTHQEEKKL